MISTNNNLTIKIPSMPFACLSKGIDELLSNLREGSGFTNGSGYPTGPSIWERLSICERRLGFPVGSIIVVQATSASAKIDA
jgi:hypothetical protein